VEVNQVSHVMWQVMYHVVLRGVLPLSEEFLVVEARRAGEVAGVVEAVSQDNTS
jgi:hypothetical protein